MRNFVISDIHGAYKGLVQAVERSDFNPKVDRLIFCGDVCDGWAYTTECIEYLKTIPNLVKIKGNHDEWTLLYLGQKLKKYSWGLGNREYRMWVEQGGNATLKSMEKHDSFKMVFDFLEDMLPYYEDNHNLFVHGGIRPKSKVENNHEYDMMWDRQLVSEARLDDIGTEPTCTEYDMVFVGHTPTFMFEGTVPTQYSNVFMCDTGASYNGRLSIINVDTLEYWQSDPIIDLYPNEKAR